MKTFKTIREELYRISIPLAVFIVILLLIGLIPPEYLESDNINPKIAFWTLFLSKALYVNAGFANAHIVRKLAFRYITFKSEKEWSNNLLIISIYLGFMLAWSFGG
jgi:hypothetical protein